MAVPSDLIGCNPRSDKERQDLMKQVHARMGVIVDSAKKAGTDKLTRAQQDDFDVLEREYDRLEGLVFVDPIVNPGNGNGAGGNRPATPQRTAEWLETDEGRSFVHYLRTGESSPEFRALSVGTGSAGGYLVPEGFRSVITERKKAFDAVRRVATVITTDDGRDLPWPTNDDTSNVGSILAENTQATETDIVLGTKSLGAYKFSSDMVRFSVELLQDSDIDLVNFVSRKLGERIGRKQSQVFTTGTGTAQPLGIVAGATSGVTAASTTAITADELIDLIHTVDPAYREAAPGDFVGFMMSDTALREIRQLKDSNGSYLFTSDPATGYSGTLFGYPVAANTDMAAPAAAVKAVLFGNLTQGYVIRDVREGFLTVFRERFADYGQQAVLDLERADGTTQDVNAYRAMTMAAV